MTQATGVSRLSGSRDFERLTREGNYRSGELVSVRWVERRGSHGTRVGLAVSKKIGGAVQRNRIKRQLRAAVAAVLERSSLSKSPGRDIVLVAATDLSATNFQTLVAAVAEKLGETGLLVPSSPGTTT